MITTAPDRRTARTAKAARQQKCATCCPVPLPTSSALPQSTKCLRSTARFGLRFRSQASGNGFGVHAASMPERASCGVDERRVFALGAKPGRRRHAVKRPFFSDRKNLLERAWQFRIQILFIALAPSDNQPGTGDAKDFKYTRSQLIARVPSTKRCEIIAPFRLLTE